ncbi:MAG: hypothetical protein RL494_1604 [Bacteroidota bacterium]|jgi:four helix bundle protein
MTTNELKLRTKNFSILIINLVEKLPNSIAGKTIANQIIRSGTSIGANYRAVCRARSDREFISKMNIVLEEADETMFWLELIIDRKWFNENEVLNLLDEGNQLSAIFVSSLKTVNARISNSKI